MSARRGYYYIADGQYDGPFSTIKQAKEALEAHPLNKRAEAVSIRSLITIETKDNSGNWVTVH